MASERSKRHDLLALSFITKSISKKLLILFYFLFLFHFISFSKQFKMKMKMKGNQNPQTVLNEINLKAKSIESK